MTTEQIDLLQKRVKELDEENRSLSAAYFKRDAIATAEIQQLHGRVKELEAELKQARAYHYHGCAEFQGKGRCNCWVVSVGVKDASKYDTQVKALKSELQQLRAGLASVQKECDERNADFLNICTVNTDLRTQLEQAKTLISCETIEALPGCINKAYEKQIEQLRAENATAQKERDTCRAVIKSDCESLEEAKASLRGVLTDHEIDGDSYMVPCAFVLITTLKEKLEQLRAERALIQDHHKQRLESDSIVASCDCLTKTPAIEHHKPGCKYRLISERDQLRAERDELRRTLSETREMVFVGGMATNWNAFTARQRALWLSICEATTHDEIQAPKELRAQKESNAVTPGSPAL